MKRKMNTLHASNASAGSKKQLFPNSRKSKPSGKIGLHIFLYGIIATITFIVFLPSLKNDFTNWDDNYYIVNNPDIKGFTFHNFSQVFSSKYVGNYLPLTMLTYMAEYQLFQLTPGYYHFTSLLLHIINCLLVFALIYGLSGERLTSLLVALLFAIHPMRVESVAWIAERKDVLSSFFFLLSLLSYVQYLKMGKRRLYYICAFSLLFSLLSKPMAVSQPFVLLLIYYLKNGRLNKKILVETVPFFIMAAAFAILTLITQNVSDHSLDNYSLSLLQRICVPFYGIVFYLIKSIAPFNLCALYTFPAKFDGSMNLQLFASPIIVFVIAAAVYKFRAYSRKLIFGSLFFLITALPVLQIVIVGNAIVAERYTYIPLLGIYFIFAGLFTVLVNKTFSQNKIAKNSLFAGISIVLFIFSCMTYERCSVWKDSFTLWNDIIKKFPADVAFAGRGSAYSSIGDYDHAIQDFNRSITLNPSYGQAYLDRGIAYSNKGDFDSAIQDFSQTIRLTPSNAIAYGNRGVAYSSKGDYDHAIEDFNLAKNIDSSYALVFYCNLGVAYCHKGDFDRAIEVFNQVISRNQNSMELYYNRGLAYHGKGDDVHALDDIKMACTMGFDLACKALSEN
jgi:Flp pilus assembly protein TadD